MKKKILICLAAAATLIMIVFVFTGCGLTADNSADKETAVSSSTEAVKTEGDEYGGYDESQAERITFSGTSAKSSSPSVKTDGSSVTVSGEGTYIISGDFDGTVTIDAGKESKVQLVLDGAEINSGDYAAIYVKSADDVIITLAEGSVNMLTDSGEVYKQSDSDNKVDGVIFADCDLAFGGNGSLTISAANHGIVSKKDIEFTGGEYDITAKEKGIKGDNSISVSGGKIVIDAEDDGLHSDEDNDKDKGFIHISGGEITVRSGDDAIHASTTITVDGGKLSLSAHEGLESTVVTINDGDITIDASDDGINAAKKSDFYEPEITVNGGSIVIKMSQGDTDALDSNGSITINGGTVDITAQFPFDYDTDGKINGGTVTVNGEKVTEMTNQFGGGRAGMRGESGNREPVTDENGEEINPRDFKGFGNRESMTDENGEQVAPPDFKDFKNREQFADENGERITPPDFKEKEPKTNESKESVGSEQ